MLTQVLTLTLTHNHYPSQEIDRIKTAKDIEVKQGMQTMGAIANAMRKNAEETNADIESYKAASKAETNKGLLTDQYIKLELAKALTSNSKMYFSGSDSALGGVLNQILAPAAGAGK